MDVYNITNTLSYLWNRPVFNSPYYETVESATSLNMRRTLLLYSCAPTLVSPQWQ